MCGDNINLKLIVVGILLLFNYIICTYIYTLYEYLLKNKILLNLI